MKKIYSSYGKVNLPSKALFKTIRFFVWELWLKHKAKIKIINQAGQLPKQYVIVCNHPSAFDMFYCSYATWPNTTSFVTNRYYMFDRRIGGLMKKAGCIPKSLFTADIESVKNTIDMANKGAILGFMPEVRLSMYGELEGLPESTGRFFKKLNLPVYLCHLDGSFFIKPKWAKKIRKGPVEVTLKKLFSVEELKEATPDLVQQTMEEALYYNDFEWLKNHPEVRYKSKTIAENLESILYECPHCNEKFCLTSKGNTVKCTNCGYTVKVDDRYAFVDCGYPHYFDNFQLWFKAQKQKIADQVNAKDNFELKSKVKLSLQSNRGKGFVREAGEGTVTLNTKGLTYSGSKDGEQYDLFIPMHDTFYLCYAKDKGFQTFYGKDYYMFNPANAHESVLWYIASEQLSNNFKKLLKTDNNR